MARAGRPISSFPTVSPGNIGGVTVGKHTLTTQAELLESITGRIGRRLNRLRINRDGVPSAEFFEAFRYYQAALLGLLREQRERSRHGRDEVPIEQLKAQLRYEFSLAAGSFTDEGLEILARNLRPEAWAVLDRVRAEQSTIGKGA